MLRILLALCLGIMVGFYLQPGIFLIATSLGISAVLLVAAQLTTPYWLPMRYIGTAMAFVVLLSLGSLLTCRSLPKEATVPEKETMWLATVTQVPEEKPKSLRTILRISGKKDSLSMSVTGEKILAYLEKGEAAGQLLPGDMLWLKGPLKAIDPPANPGMFDFRAHMRSKGVAYSIYLPTAYWQKATGTDSRLLIRRTSARLNAGIQDILYRYLTDPADQAIVSGILLGARAQLDDDTMQQFSQAGIIHILSVSGMHVAILYGILLLFFRWVPPQNRKQQLAKEVIILAAIWLFAFITGLTPAVQRAAFMFSLLIGGKMLNRHAESINLLAGSAVVLLLFNPGLLFNIGFQLSYAAVAGIMLWYKPLYHSYHAPNRLTDLAWQTSAVSVSAQLATAPLCWYYFGQFPLYFLLGNLLAVPLSTAIMWLGIVLTAVSPLPFLAKGIAWLLHWADFLLIEGTAIISRLPGASIAEGFLPVTGVLLLFVIMTGFSFAWLLHKKAGIWTGLTALVLLISLLQWHRWQSLREGEVMVWHIPGHSAVVSRSGSHVTLWGDSSLLKDKSKMDYHFGGYLKRSHASFHSIQYLGGKEQPAIITQGKTIGIYDKTSAYAPVVPTDMVIIRNNPYLDTVRIMAPLVILDGSNYPNKKQLYKRLLPGKQVLDGRSAISL